MKWVLTFSVLLLPIFTVWSQGIYSAGVLPQINLNVPLIKDWRLNAKVESRQLFSKRQFDKNFKTTYRYDLTDIAFIASIKAGANSSLGMGYMIRFRDNAVTHRFIQQYSIVKKHDQFRFGHRISTDQTIRNNNSVQLRLRYRVGLERALNGTDVDPKEFYFKLNNEYIFSNEGNDRDFELRLIPAFGYAFNEYNKVECGIDYRVSEFMAGASRNQFWLYLGWFISR
jgi:hypothetical protein